MFGLGFRVWGLGFRGMVCVFGFQLYFVHLEGRHFVVVSEVPDIGLQP